MKLLIQILVLALSVNAWAVSLDSSKWRISFSSPGIGIPHPTNGSQNPYGTVTPTFFCKRQGPNAIYKQCLEKYNALVGSMTWYFDFPKSSQNGHVNYVYTQNQNISEASSITMRVRMTANSPGQIFDVFQTGGLAANVRLFFGYQIQSSAYERWWSNPTTIFLAPGEFEVTVPLHPSLWSSVYGEFGNASQAALVGWNAAIGKHEVFTGFTFGGGSFFGHGVALDDTIPGHEGDEFRFELLKYTIN